MTCDTHLTLRANAVAMTLTERERIAFAVAMIGTILRPSRAGDVLLAARHIREHGEALLDADLAGLGSDRAVINPFIHSSGGAETGNPHGTIEHWSPSEIPGPRLDGVTPGDPGRSLSSPSLGAAWAHIRAGVDAIEDSPLGDGIAGVCMFAIGIAALFAPLIWG